MTEIISEKKMPVVVGVIDVEKIPVIILYRHSRLCIETLITGRPQKTMMSCTTADTRLSADCQLVYTTMMFV